MYAATANNEPTGLLHVAYISQSGGLGILREVVCGFSKETKTRGFPPLSLGGSGFIVFLLRKCTLSDVPPSSVAVGTRVQQLMYSSFLPVSLHTVMALIHPALSSVSPRCILGAMSR